MTRWSQYALLAGVGLGGVVNALGAQRSIWWLYLVAWFFTTACATGYGFDACARRFVGRAGRDGR